MNGPASTPPPASAPRPSPAAPPGGALAPSLSRSLCAFWLGEKAYAVETSIVGEVLTVERFIPVPGTPPAVVGLFNLRGTPLSLVDLRAVLELPRENRAEPRSRTVLVLRNGNTLLTGVLIDRMERVIQAGQGAFTPKDSSDESPVVQGFLEIQARETLVLTVLDSAVLFGRLERLKFR
jgi:purine-binding chemotaxis protein CheW